MVSFNEQFTLDAIGEIRTWIKLIAIELLAVITLLTMIIYVFKR